MVLPLLAITFVLAQPTSPATEPNDLVLDLVEVVDGGPETAELMVTDPPPTGRPTLPPSDTDPPTSLLKRLDPIRAPLSAIGTLGDELTDPRSLQIPLHFVDVVLEPVREANLLLPRKLDPFSKSDAPWLSARLAPVPEKTPAEFTPSKQQQLLSTQLAERADIPDAEADWRYRVQAGGSFRQGNVANTNARLLLQAERRSIRSTSMGKLEAIYNSDGQNNENRRAQVEFIQDRNLRGNWIAYGRETLEYDRARLIDLRSVTSSGLGFRFIDQLESRWVVRTGPTVSYIIYDPLAGNPDEARSGWLLESEYRRLVFDAVRLEWTWTALPDFDSEQQFRVRNEGAVVFPIGGKTSHWNWKIGVNHEYQVDPVNATKSSDVEGYFAIAYSN